MSTKITIPVKLNSKVFRHFSWFDMFILRKRWVRPVVFALILIAFAAVALLSGKAQAGLIAAVLLVVGLGLPLVWFGSFLSQVNLQAERLHLDNPRPVYTLTLDYDGLRVVNNMKKEDAQVVKWADVQAAFRRKDCIYIYVSTVRAYLLPSGQADVSDDALWAYLKERIGDRCK